MFQNIRVNVPKMTEWIELNKKNPICKILNNNSDIKY